MYIKGKHMNKNISKYPFILKPYTIQKIFKQLPPTPDPPKISPKPILQLRRKPTPPVISEEPKELKNLTELPNRTIFYAFLAFIELIVVIISNLIHTSINNQIIGSVIGLIIFISLTILLIIFGIEYQNKYLEIKRNNQNKQNIYNSWKNQKNKILKRHNQEIKIWEDDINNSKQKYQDELKRWTKEKDKLEEIFNYEMQKSRMPNEIKKWRQKVLKQKMASLQPSNLENNVDLNIKEDPRGYAEVPKNCPFSKLLKQYFGENKIHILRYVNGIIPDFSYIDAENNLFIDIEIDEPYTPRQYPETDKKLKLTHCLEQNNYTERDNKVISSDWFVIHFSEKQILSEYKSCCKEIAKLIYELTGNKTIINKFSNIQDLKREPRWTIEEAKAMAEKRDRLFYKETKDRTVKLKKKNY